MGPDDPLFRRGEQRAMTITQNATAEQMAAFFGMSGHLLPAVTVNTALRVPAVLAAVSFLSRTLATVRLGAYLETEAGPEEVTGRLQVIVRDAPNPYWSSFEARRFFWQNVFLRGRGLMVIVRSNSGQPQELWPVNTSAVSVSSDQFGRKSYKLTVGDAPAGLKTYSATDVIDVPFMLGPNMVEALSPIRLGEKAIQLALAMNDYGSTFFAGGGVPPLSLQGPLPAGPDAMNRAMDQVHRAIEVAKKSDKPIFPMPPDYKLEQVGYDPAKGQMTEARRLQIEEIARVFQLPPVFLQDLTRSTFSNTEQQDLHLVKHVISQWAEALEQEMNLKLFGQMNGKRYVRHDVDSLQRGDFKTRMEGLVRSVQGGIRTPNEGRLSEGLPAHTDPNADRLYMQGATVPLGEHSNAPTPPTNGDTQNDDGNQG